jgi:hypothetical protein
VVPDYSPRGIGKLIDDAIALYRAEFRTIAVPAAYLLLPLALVSGVAQVFYFRATFGTMSLSPDAPEAASLGELYRIMAAYAVTMTALMGFGVAALYFASAVWNAAPALLTREPVAPGAFLRGGRARFGWVFLASIVVYLVYTVGVTASFAGMFLFVLPGIAIIVLTLVALVHLSMAMPIVVLEHGSIDGSLRRSVALVRGNGWRTVRFWVATSIVIYALQAGIGSFGSIGSAVSATRNAAFSIPLVWQVVAGVVQGVGQALAQPLLYIAWMLFYLDLRARNEGVDLLMRAQALTAGTS